MARFVALLRGINVSNRRASKATLAGVFTELGYEDVSTFRASGNVLFGAPGKAKPKASEMEAALEAQLGYAVPVFLRSASQVAKVATLEPFSPQQVKASKGKLQVAFLPRKPRKADGAAALALELESVPLSL